MKSQKKNREIVRTEARPRTFQKWKKALTLQDISGAHLLGDLGVRFGEEQQNFDHCLNIRIRFGILSLELG